MTDTKTDKKLKLVYLAVVGVLAFQFFDVLLVSGSNAVLSSNIIARIAGFVIMVAVSVKMKINIKRFCFKSYGWPFEFMYGALFSVVPAALCYVAMKFSLAIKGYDVNYVFTVPNQGLPPELDRKVLHLLGFAIALFVGIVFKEMFYRAFLITQLTEKYGVYKANFIQSFFYTLSVVPIIISGYLSGTFTHLGLKMTLFVVFGHLLNYFISGLKWGFFYRVNGTVWMAVSDHFFNNFILTCIVTANPLPEKWIVVETLVIQLISCLMFLPLYIKRDRDNIEMAAEAALGKEILSSGVETLAPSLGEAVKNRIARKKDDSSAQNQTTDEASEGGDDGLSDYTNLNTEQIDGFFGDIVSSMAHENADVTQNIPDELATQTENYAENASAVAMDYFDKSLDREAQRAEKARSEEDSQTNTDNISRLVQDFFEESFNKHTFTDDKKQ